MRAVAPLDLLAEGLGDLRASVAGDPGTSQATVDELARLEALAAGLGSYLERCTTPESVELAALAEATRAHAWSGTLEAEMLSGHVEGQFLAMLVRATGAKRVLEIGVFSGYSALAIAEALPGDGSLVACEIDVDAAAMARDALDRSEAGARVAIEVGPASSTLDGLAARGAPFDLVFIDADKVGYIGYYDAILAAGLLAPGGLICVDNTLMQGEPWASHPSSEPGTAIARFNEHVAADVRVRQVLLPLRDGLTLIQQV